MKDINNDNAPLGLEYVIDSIKNTINPMYLKPEAQAQGGGTPPSQQGGNTDASKMTEAERTNLFKTNPTAFNQMFGQK